ncbi:MAG: hypothetical protein AB2766_19700 [Candidatus Thiodiazotropha endolucinida]
MKGVVGIAKRHSKLIWPTSTVGQNWTFSFKSNMAPEGAANGIIYAIFLRLAIPIKSTKLNWNLSATRLTTLLLIIKEFNKSQDFTCATQSVLDNRRHASGVISES